MTHGRPLLAILGGVLLAGCASLGGQLPGGALGPTRQPGAPLEAATPRPVPEAAIPQTPPPADPPPVVPLTQAGADGVWLPREEAARLFSRHQQADLLDREVASLKDELAVERRKVVALRELVAIERAKAEGRGELAKIEGERREAWQQRADEAERKSRWSRTAAHAGIGAAAGSLAAPPIGTAVGALVGALIGFFSSP